jgi:acetylornithine deacetylase/succinyl-diaminopimelate desuccinylase-like protein
MTPTLTPTAGAPRPSCRLALAAALLLALPVAAATKRSDDASDPRPRFELSTTEAFDPASIAPYPDEHPKIYAYIDAHRDQHLAELQRWLRQPSISAQDVGIDAMAEMLRADLEALGFQEAEVVPTSGHPGVWGFLDAGAPKTLLVYMMYDVQPVEPEDWRSPPFEAAIVEHELGRVVMARGATNQKGPQRAFLNAVESILAVEGRLPVNLMVLAEGEEELGSPHYPELVDRFEQRLRSADGVFFPFNSQGTNGEMSVSLGVKGILYFEIEARGGSWGGPKAAEIHGSFKALVDSPAWRLVQALASMTTPDGNTILVDGYYDGIRPPTPEEERLIQGVARTWNGQRMRALMQIDRWVDGLDGVDAVLRHLYDTTLNIDGMWSGYTGEGVKTILPHVATAKVDSRLPPGLDPERQLEKIRRHLDRHGYADLELRKLSAYPAAQTSIESPWVRSAIAVFQKWGRVTEVWPRLAGSAPFYQFTERLRLPLVFNGLGHGSGAHAPNEYMVVEPKPGSGIAGLAGIEKGYVDLLYALAGEPAAAAEGR